jgi:hypothetical protein
MSGRNSGRGGRGRGRGRGGRTARGNTYSGASNTRQKGLCAALGDNVFNYGQKGSADQMRTSWEKIVHHVGTIMSQEKSNELLNRIQVVVPQPQHDAAIITKHAVDESRRLIQHNRILNARTDKMAALNTAYLAADLDSAADLGLKMAELENEMEEALYTISIPLPMTLEGDNKDAHNAKWRIYRETESQLIKQRGQAYSMIRGQCMQVLLDKMKHDPDWTTTSASYDPLVLFKLIEKTILAQTSDQYPFATVYEQEMSLFGFHQNVLTNDQWYERFNTKVEIGKAIGIARQHPVLLEYVSQETNSSSYATLAAADKLTVETDTEERYLSYIFLKQSGKQHDKLRMYLSDSYTTGDDKNPKTRQEVLHQLDKHSKTVVSKTVVADQGNSFAQQGSGSVNTTNRGGDTRNGDSYDQNFWKDKTCFKCNKKGHPASHCKDKEDSDDRSSSRSSQSSKTSIAKLKKDLKKSAKANKKSFTTLQAQIEELEENSDMTNSDDDDDEESSHLLINETSSHHLFYNKKNESLESPGDLHPCPNCVSPGDLHPRPNCVSVKQKE